VRLLRVTALACAALAPAACARRGLATYPDASVVLVSIDTLRADRIGPYGYAKGRTPRLDRLAREGLVFDDVYSHVPLTLPAHASLLTGLLPPRHEVRDNLGFRLPDRHRTLAERFQAAGLATGGAVSAYVLRAQTGIARGFGSWDDAFTIAAGDPSLGDLQRDGAVAVESLLRFTAAQRGRRFFAFLHLYEPHSPWSPPAAYRDLASPYDGDVAYADELLGRFLDGLAAQGLADTVVLAVTSDHGEGLGDHGEQEHGIFLYREAVHVPLLLRLPGSVGAGRRVPGPTAQVDVAATLLDLAGLPVAGMDGESLREAMRTGAAAERSVYSETLYPRYHFGWSDLYAASDARYRYIRAPRPELYDLRADPGETQNVAPRRAPAAAAMDAWLARTMGAVTAPAEVDAATREKLAALGYVGAGTPVPEGTTLPDPKDTIGAYEDLKQGLALRRSGRLPEAAAQLERVTAANPRMVDAWEALGMTLVDLGRSKEAASAFDAVVRIDPLRAEPHLALARLHGLEGRLEPAIRHAELASGRDPGRAFEILAQVMMDAKRPADAASFARRSLASDPRRVMSHFVLGVVARQQGRCEEAVVSLQRAAEVERSERGSIVRSLHYQLGDCLARLGRDADAEREFRTELAAVPSSPEARVGLAMLYRSQGRDAESREVLAGLATTSPSPDAYWTIVRTFGILGDTEAARSWAAQARQRFPADPRFR
jgi:arylsulfatase A-like enzyme/tetratricopeptide (TPR) repeat protein